jgi:hypothetical protein
VNDKQLAKLIKQNVAKAELAAKKKVGKKYDSTLDATKKPEDDGDDVIERQQFFKEMRKREF